MHVGMYIKAKPCLRMVGFSEGRNSGYSFHFCLAEDGTQAALVTLQFNILPPRFRCLNLKAVVDNGHMLLHGHSSRCGCLLELRRLGCACGAFMGRHQESSGVEEPMSSQIHSVFLFLSFTIILVVCLKMFEVQLVNSIIFTNFVSHPRPPIRLAKVMPRKSPGCVAGQRLWRFPSFSALGR